MTTDIKVIEADDKNILNIASLFHRFFEAEGFSNTREAIAANIEVMRHNENCWIAAAMHDGQIVLRVCASRLANRSEWPSRSSWQNDCDGRVTKELLFGCNSRSPASTIVTHSKNGLADWRR